MQPRKDKERKMEDSVKKSQVVDPHLDILFQIERNTANTANSVAYLETFFRAWSKNVRSLCWLALAIVVIPLVLMTLFALISGLVPIKL